MLVARRTTVLLPETCPLVMQRTLVMERTRLASTIVATGNLLSHPYHQGVRDLILLDTYDQRGDLTNQVDNGSRQGWIKDEKSQEYVLSNVEARLVWSIFSLEGFCISSALVALPEFGWQE